MTTEPPPAFAMPFRDRLRGEELVIEVQRQSARRQSSGSTSLHIMAIVLTGVVDENIDATALMLDPRQRYPAGPGYQSHRMGGTKRRVSEARAAPFFGIDVDKRNARSLRHEGLHNLLADARSAAGDHHRALCRERY